MPAKTLQVKAGFEYKTMPTGIYKHKLHLAESKRKMSEAHKGKKHSEETKKKMSEARKKRKKRLGYLNTLEAREKISKALKGKPSSVLGKHWNLSEKARKNIGNARKGCNCTFWKGGITPENLLIRMGIEFRLWREAVFKRDDYTCRKCKRRGVALQAHHIFNFAEYLELRFEVANGITFCKDCHKEFHKKYGVKNNNNKQIIEFLELKELEELTNKLNIPFYEKGEK